MAPQIVRSPTQGEVIPMYCGSTEIVTGIVAAPRTETAARCLGLARLSPVRCGKRSKALTLSRSALSAAAISRSIAISSARQVVTVANRSANRCAESRSVASLVPPSSVIRRASLRS